MSTLDEKLKKIYNGCDCGSVCEFCADVSHLNNQIKQAFIDEGWRHLSTPEIIERWGRDAVEYRVNGRTVMTGPEWYERFKKELHKYTSVTIHTEYNNFEAMTSVDVAMKAAKRASGVE